MTEKMKKLRSVDRMAESAVAVIQRCSVNNNFSKLVQNSQENTCAGVPF